MRSRLVVPAVVLILAACSEPGVGPDAPLLTAPAVQLSQIGADPATDDLCGGLSPCDAYDYRGDGSVGAAGMCFLPPTVDNHLADPACSAPNTPGLSGVFQLAWCQVDYSADPTGATPPTIVAGTCQDPSDWVDLVEESGHYAASVRWRRNDADVGDIFRVYVVRGGRTFAHRDVVIDPNLTTPADDFVHAIGFGNEPIKLVITDDFSCVKYDTQQAGTDNAATCVIAGETSLSFTTDEGQVVTTFNFPDGNPTFLADFELSECLSLGFDLNSNGIATGQALVDTPLADCKISLSSEELDMLTVPGQIVVNVLDPRWSDDPADAAPFEHARLNVLQYDEYGIGALPPSTPPTPNWFGMATSSSAALRWLSRGLDKLAGLFLPEPLYAFQGAGWDFTRMSDFQVAVMGVMDASDFGAACTSGEDYCVDLGSYPASDPVASVSVKVSAPSAAGATEYPNAHIPVPDTRLHFFPEAGDSVACRSTTLGAYGRGCVPAQSPDSSTSPPSFWDHVVVITDTDGIGSVDWILGGGNSTLRVAACGVARPGDHEPDPPAEPGADGVWGSLGDCSNRSASMVDPSAYDNGPADGLTPFEPVDIDHEVALYGLPLEMRARTCPSITVDGVKADAFGGSEWEACAEKTVFTAPQQGPKVENNAALYTYSDGDSLFVGVEVQSTDLGNRIFLNFVENFTSGGAGIEAAGDELLLLDFGDASAPIDWHYTQSCVDNNSSSLCGVQDTAGDGPGLAAFGAATQGGAGTGTVFYEFVRPLGSPNAATGPGKEDLGAASGATVGLRVTVTQGKGGGKGGFIYPDPQTSPVEYHSFTIE